MSAEHVVGPSFEEIRWEVGTTLGITTHLIIVWGPARKRQLKLVALWWDPSIGKVSALLVACVWELMH